ncbi:MAG: hypothetical protein KF805_12660 [Phycisphaeraceae bacterium]|nr:hypothetical protein [Phycisphaeraceae bacterium]
MCKPVSGLINSDHTIHLPSPELWEHSHSTLASKVGIPDGLLGDKWVRFELSPKGDDFSTPVSEWLLHLDEHRHVDWWGAELPAIDDKIRRAVDRYMTAARSAGSAPGSAITSTGYMAASSSTGDRAASSSTGDMAASSSTGDESAAVATGYGSAVRGAKGCALLAAERDENYKLIAWAFGVVDGKAIKPGVWYEAKTGKLKACSEERCAEIEAVLAQAGSEAVKPEACGPQAK